VESADRVDDPVRTLVLRLPGGGRVNTMRRAGFMLNRIKRRAGALMMFVNTSIFLFQDAIDLKSPACLAVEASNIVSDNIAKAGKP